MFLSYISNSRKGKNIEKFRGVVLGALRANCHIGQTYIQSNL